MHVGTLAGLPPALKLMGIAAGTPIGNYTDSRYGGLARAFVDPVSLTAFNTADCSLSTPAGQGLLGLLLPAPKSIRGYKAWSSGYGWDGASQGATITQELQASNDTTTGLDGTWATLHSASFADVWGVQDIRDVLLDEATPPYRAYRLRTTGTFHSGGQYYYCNGLRFYMYSYF